MAWFTRAQQSQRRDPTAATLTASYSAPGRPMQTAWDAKAAIRNGMYASVTVAACVNFLASAVASCPYVTGRRFKDKTTLADTTTDRLSRLLGPPPGSPNPETSARRLWAYWVAQRTVTGKYLAELELDKSGQVVGLWPYPAGDVRPIPSQGGREYFSAFEFGTRPNLRTLPKDQVFYAWRPSQLDYRQPESVLEAAKLDINSEVAQARYDWAFWLNDARPAQLIVTPEFPNEQQRRGFQQQWQGRHGGPDNAGRTAFSEQASFDPAQGVKGLIEIITLGASGKDAQALQQAAAKMQRICMAIGVPMAALDASGRTFSNAGIEMQNCWEATILPLLDDLADEVNMRLAPRLGNTVGWFTTDHVMALRPPAKFQNLAPLELLKAHVIDPDEMRTDMGFAPMTAEQRAAHDLAMCEDGMTLDVQARAALALVQAGFDPASVAEVVCLPGLTVAATMPADPAVPAGLPMPADPSMDGATGMGSGHMAVRDLGTVDPKLDADALADAEETRRAGLWRSADTTVTGLEGTWERTWRTHFDRQATATLARLDTKAGRQALRHLAQRAETPPPADAAGLTPDEIAGVFDVHHWTAQAADVADGLYTAVFAAGATSVTSTFDVGFDLSAPYVDDWIKARANQLAGQVTDTTYSAIKDTLIEGVVDGETYDALAGRVQDVFTEASDIRAATIARTEVHGAYQQSALQVAQELPGIIAGREWLATRDDRTRDAHAEADGQVAAMGHPFTVMGEQIMAPGEGSAANAIRCRCQQAFMTAEEFAAAQARTAPQVARETVLLLLPRLAAGTVDLADAFMETHA